MGLVPSNPADQKKLLAILAPVLLLGAYWYFIHGDRTEEVGRMESRLETLHAQNASARTLAVRGGEDLAERMGIYEQYMIRLERLIPRREEVSQLLHDISERAQQVGVNLALVRPEPETPGQYYTRQTYEMAVVGRYHDVGVFLTEVGSLPRIITPIDLRVTPAGAAARRGARAADEQRPELTANFRIETYIIPQAVRDTAGADGNGRS